MNLSLCKTVVSVIINVDDPQREGNVQCNIPGYIDDSAMSKEIIPWVKPLMMGRVQSFTKPQVGDKALVLINEENDKEYWYVLLNEPHQLLKTFLNAKYNKNPEVLVCQDHGDKQILFTYDDEDGFVLRIGDNVLALRPDGTVDMSSAKSVGVGVSGSTLKLGNSGQSSGGGGGGGGSSSGGGGGGGGSSSGGGGFSPAVLGDELEKRLTSLKAAFDELAVAAESCPYTTVLIDSIKKCSESLEDLNEIKSDTVEISKNDVGGEQQQDVQSKQQEQQMSEAEKNQAGQARYNNFKAQLNHSLNPNVPTVIPSATPVSTIDFFGAAGWKKDGDQQI